MQRVRGTTNVRIQSVVWSALRNRVWGKAPSFPCGKRIIIQEECSGTSGEHPTKSTRWRRKILEDHGMEPKQASWEWIMTRVWGIWECGKNIKSYPAPTVIIIITFCVHVLWLPSHSAIDSVTRNHTRRLLLHSSGSLKSKWWRSWAPPKPPGKDLAPPPPSLPAPQVFLGLWMHHPILTPLSHDCLLPMCLYVIRPLCPKFPFS